MLQDLPLDDDTVMNNVKFADDSILDTPDLSAFELVLIMGLMLVYCSYAFLLVTFLVNDLL